MTDSGIQAKLDILDNIATELLEWIYIILFIAVLIALAWVICYLIGKVCILFVKGLRVIFGKIKKPKFKELHFPKHKQDNYSVDVYLNNTMRYLLETPDYNVRAISEIRYAMIKGHYKFQPDVRAKLSARFPDWQFPEED